MSQIAVVGLGPYEEARLVSSNFLFLQIRHEDVIQGTDLSRFKVILFPARLGFHDPQMLGLLQRSLPFRKEFSRFVSKGGRAIMFAPLELESDWTFGNRGERTMKIRWMPFPCLVRKIGYRNIDIVAPPSARTQRRRQSVRVRQYAKFETTWRQTAPWLKLPTGEPVAVSASVARGAVMFCPVSLANSSEDSAVPAASPVFEAMIEWGLNHPSLAMTWDMGSLPTRFRGLQGLTNAVDVAVTEGNHQNAILLAWQAFERMLKTSLSIEAEERRSAKELISSKYEMPEGNRDGELEWYIGEALRVFRNRLTHEPEALSEQLSSDELDFFLSGSRVLIRQLSR